MRRGPDRLHLAPALHRRLARRCGSGPSATSRRRPTSCRRRPASPTRMYNGIASNLYVGHIGATLGETLLGFVARLRAGLHARHRGRAVAHASNITSIRSSSCSRRCRRWRCAAHPRLVRTGADLQGHQRGAGRLLPADGQHHRRPALGGRGPHQPDALAVGLALADLPHAAAAERHALHLRRPRDRDDLRADRRHRRRARRRRKGPRHADAEHELHAWMWPASSPFCSSCRSWA